MRAREAFYYVAGLVFLVLAKAKNALLGYVTPKPYGIADVDRCISYDLEVVDNWMRHLGRYLDADALSALRDSDVLELGPGSDLGVGLYLLALGAATYSSCDVNDLASHVPESFYDAFLATLAGRQDEVPTAALRRELSAVREGAPSRLTYVVRDDFDLVSAFGRDSFDIAFSHQAFEHFDDVDATVADLTRVCRPGAVAVLMIDLKTHSRWIRTKDPDNIYRYPAWLYRMLTFRGSPNRIRPYRYVESFGSQGWQDVRVEPVRQLPTAGQLDLDPAFRDPTNQMELLSIMLCARLPEA